MPGVRRAVYSKRSRFAFFEVHKVNARTQTRATAEPSRLPAGTEAIFFVPNRGYLRRPSKPILTSCRSVHSTLYCRRANRVRFLGYPPTYNSGHACRPIPPSGDVARMPVRATLVLLTTCYTFPVAKGMWDCNVRHSRPAVFRVSAPYSQ